MAAAVCGGRAAAAVRAAVPAEPEPAPAAAPGVEPQPQPQPQPRCAYELLGVAHDAQPAEIRRAFLQLARERHPDKAPGDDSAGQFDALRQAYATLADEERRKQYDADRALRRAKEECVAIWAEVEEADLEPGPSDTLRYPCRCGAHFEVAPPPAQGQAPASLLVACPSCSLVLRVQLG